MTNVCPFTRFLKELMFSKGVFISNYRGLKQILTFFFIAMTFDEDCGSSFTIKTHSISFSFKQENCSLQHCSKYHLKCPWFILLDPLSKSGINYPSYQTVFCNDQTRRRTIQCSNTMQSLKFVLHSKHIKEGIIRFELLTIRSFNRRFYLIYILLNNFQHPECYIIYSGNNCSGFISYKFRLGLGFSAIGMICINLVQS